MWTLLLCAASLPAPASAQRPPQLRQKDRVRLAEARRLADRVCERLWPGWGRTKFQVLLVSESAEFLVGHPPATEAFAPLGYDALLGSEVWVRDRRFPPNLLATFPAVGGVPTVVIGTAERTGKSSTDWVLTLLHEHFHQWQSSRPDYYSGVARLDLAGGDTTGQWMLNYAFPYDSVPVQRAMRHLATALAAGLLDDVVAARDTLRGLLSAAHYRYFEFQLWQEGAARYTEYAVARAAQIAGAPLAEFRKLPDFEPYDSAYRRRRLDLRRELEQLDLGRSRRVAVYPVGAALALVLETARPDWKQAYVRRPFELAALLPIQERDTTR
jgi:hypothetical protein